MSEQQDETGRPSATPGKTAGPRLIDLDEVQAWPGTVFDPMAFPGSTPEPVVRTVRYWVNQPVPGESPVGLVRSAFREFELNTDLMPSLPCVGSRPFVSDEWLKPTHLVVSTYVYVGQESAVSARFITRQGEDQVERRWLTLSLMLAWFPGLRPVLDQWVGAADVASILVDDELDRRRRAGELIGF